MLTVRLCRSFIANSEVVKISNSIHLGVPLKKIEVITRGRSSKNFQFQPPNMFSKAPIRFFNVGRLVPVKGQDYLIRAFSQFLKYYPDAILHIAGEGPYRKTLSDLILKLNIQKNVILLGERKDIAQLMNNYDCLVSPSLSEGFSGTLVEAMFSGLPVFASDIPSNKEIINHLSTGYLFQHGSVESILNSMLWFAKNSESAANQAFNAYSYALQNFEQDKQAARLEQHLCNLINHPK